MPWLAIDEQVDRSNHNNDYLAERSGRAPSLCWITIILVIWMFKPDHRQIDTCVMQAGLSMVVWILKREVRAIGGCLGIHRR